MLELINLKKTYVTKSGQTIALNGVNIKFADKGLVFITGKSGCGKTTLLNMIGGLDNFDSGDIIVDGKKFSEFTPSDYDSYRNTLVGFVFQEYNLLSEYTIEKNIEIANELQGKKADEKHIEELLNIVEISDYKNRKPNQLSGGQKQRVAIARALIKNPKIVLADEPTGALDSNTGIQVMELLKRLSKDKLIIVVSHEMEFAEKYGDRIIRIVDGQVVEDITLNDVEINSNVFNAKEEVVVRAGKKLNQEETAQLLQALEQKKKINITDNIIVRQKEKTGEIKNDKDENVNFIKSKMKFKSVFGLGAKSLVTKPVRLVFTILLSVIAFAVFGVFDSVASYNGQRAVTNLLRTSDGAVSIGATYNIDAKYLGNDLKLTQSYINALNEDTGYTFRGVYDIDDQDKITNGQWSNLNKSINLSDLYIKSSVDVPAKEYYKRNVNGIIEFGANEIKGNKIAPNEYNYKIIYGQYPSLAQNPTDEQEVGISKYMAESIMYWLGKKDSNTFDGKRIDTMEDLLYTSIILDNTDKKFAISAIIDCGEIPEKYEKLKNIEGDFPYNLARDFNTYLNCNCNLMLFAPKGYVANTRENNSRKTSYAIGCEDSIVYKAKLSNKEAKMEYFYYNQAEFDGTDTILFNDLEEDKQVGATPNLQSNEVLVNINNLKLLFAYDRQLAVSKGNLGQAGRLDAYSSIAMDSESTILERRQAIKDILELNKEIHDNNSYDILGADSKDIFINLYENNQFLEELSGKKVKVVGVYFGVDTDIEVTSSTIAKYLPFVMSKGGLESLGIYTNQGIYSRAISGPNRSIYGTKLLAKMFGDQQGFSVYWYENSILQILDENAEFINQFLELFLYVAIVIVLFSMFMLMNYITTSIVSKRQSIGVLRALGTRGKSVFEMFLIESLLIALINGAIACLVGYLASIIVNNYLLEVMNLTIRFALFGGRQIIIILCASIVTGILASLLPIIKIVKEKPVALIRKE